MIPQTLNLDALQKLISVTFKDPTLLFQSLIHRSYLNENRSTIKSSNERLEFLGDAVLELWATETLFGLFPDLPEGDLTNLRSLVVCTENLAAIAKNIDISTYILLSRGEESHQGRENPSILADTFESITGAIYLDQGMVSAKDYLNQFVMPTIATIGKLKVFKDPKSMFQEIAQAKRGVTPHYVTVSEIGPDHRKEFEVAAFIGEDLIAKGKGNSKQKAEESAATAATTLLSQS